MRSTIAFFFEHKVYRKGRLHFSIPCEGSKHRGNSSRIKVKSKQDLINDAEKGVRTHYTGKIITTPVKDLIHAEKVRSTKSKYDVRQMIGELHKVNDY